MKLIRSSRQTPLVHSVVDEVNTNSVQASHSVRTLAKMDPDCWPGESLHDEPHARYSQLTLRKFQKFWNFIFGKFTLYIHKKWC